jgi:hypothetical protein
MFHATRSYISEGRRKCLPAYTAFSPSSSSILKTQTYQSKDNIWYIEILSEMLQGKLETFLHKNSELILFLKFLLRHHYILNRGSELTSTWRSMDMKQRFLVYPPVGNMARKQCFLACSPSENKARKQCFLVLLTFRKHGYRKHWFLLSYFA